MFPVEVPTPFLVENIPPPNPWVHPQHSVDLPFSPFKIVDRPEDSLPIGWGVAASRGLTKHEFPHCHMLQRTGNHRRIGCVFIIQLMRW